MKKANDTERRILDAIDRLVAGECCVCDGKFTQENISREAGISRATFNRCPAAVAAYRKIRAMAVAGENIKPLTIEAKNRECNESITALKKQLSEIKGKYETELSKARQEIYILRTILQKREIEQIARQTELERLREELGVTRPSAVTHLR